METKMEHNAQIATLKWQQIFGCSIVNTSEMLLWASHYSLHGYYKPITTLESFFQFWWTMMRSLASRASEAESFILLVCLLFYFDSLISSRVSAFDILFLFLPPFLWLLDFNSCVSLKVQPLIVLTCVLLLSPLAFGGSLLFLHGVFRFVGFSFFHFPCLFLLSCHLILVSIIFSLV